MSTYDEEVGGDYGGPSRKYKLSRWSRYSQSHNWSRIVLSPYLYHPLFFLFFFCYRNRAITSFLPFNMGFGKVVALIKGEGDDANFPPGLLAVS